MEKTIMFHYEEKLKELKVESKSDIYTIKYTVEKAQIFIKDN